MKLKSAYLIIVITFVSVALYSFDKKSDIVKKEMHSCQSQIDNGNTIEIINSCSYHKKNESQFVYLYNPEIDAEFTIEKIMKLVGLPSNFTIKRANVQNAMATVIKTNDGTFERFILYDQNFMNSVRLSTGNNYSEWSILAHEIGHHLSGHTLTLLGDNHKQELEADEFSGFVMYKMGATLEEAQSAINKFCTHEGSITHPPKYRRLKAIEKGWYNAKNNSPNSVDVSGGKTGNVLTYRGELVTMLFQSVESGGNMHTKIIGTNPLCRYIPSSKKWQISYSDEENKFQMIELSYIKDTDSGAIMRDTHGALYSVTNGVNSDGMLFCQLLDLTGEAFVYLSFEGLKRN